MGWWNEDGLTIGDEPIDRLAHALDLQVNRPLAHRRHAGQVLAPVAVEQRDGVAGADPADDGEVAGLGPVEQDGAGGQRTGDEIAVGHELVRRIALFPVGGAC